MLKVYVNNVNYVNYVNSWYVSDEIMLKSYNSFVVCKL